jgi:hypothetical protein
VWLPQRWGGALRLVVNTLLTGALVFGSLIALDVGTAEASTISAAWQIVPSPAVASSTLAAIDCVSTSWCVAVGSDTGGSSPVGLVEMWNGATWTVVPPPSGGSSAETLDAVSCASQLFCMATGYGPLGTFVQTWDGTTWSVAAPPGNTSAGLSCLSANFCAATGSYSYEHDEATWLQLWNGSTWTSTPQTGGLLSAITCLTTT